MVEMTRKEWEQLKRQWEKSELTNEQMIGQVFLRVWDAYEMGVSNRQEHARFVSKVQKLLTKIVARLTALEQKIEGRGQRTE